MDDTNHPPSDLDAILADATRLAALAQTGLPGSAAEPSFDRLARLAGKLLGVPVALVSLVDAERQFFKACVGLPEPWATKRETPLSHSFCKHVVVSGEPLVIADARTDPRVKDNLAVPDIGVIAYLGIPITVSGQVIGSFCAIDGKPRAWTPDDVAMMSDLAASVISEIRLRAEMTERERQHQATEEAKQNIEVTLASIGDAVIATDAAGLVTYINPVACQLCGWPAREAIGRPATAVFNIVEAETGKPFDRFVTHVLESGESIAWRDHTILLARTGERREIEESVNAIRVGGRITGAVITFRDISKRRAHQLEIEAREHLFRTLADSIPQLAWMAEPDGHIFWYNTRWYEYTGTYLEEMQGWGWRSVHDPEVLPDVVERISHSFATGEPFEMTFPLRGVDGVFRPFLTRMVPLKDDSGTVRRWFGTNTDVTDATQIEAELRDARTRLDSALSAGSVATFAWDIPHDRFVGDANMARFYAIPPEERDGGPVSSYFNAIHPDDRGPIAASLNQAIASGEPFEEEYRIVQAGEPDRWVVGRGGFRRDERGRSIAMSGVILDISERKRAEETIRESEERFRTLFNSMDEGFCILQLRYDAAGEPEDYRFLMSNPAFETIVRIGNPTGKWASEVLPGLDRTWHETYARISLTGVPERFEMVEQVLEGRSFTAYAFRIGDPSEHKVAVLFSDITHRIRNQAERERLLDQLTDADRRKDEFLAMLAHELRNPLGAISAGVQLVQKVQKPEVLAELRGMIQHQVQHLTHLIDDLLDVSRITQGKVELRKETVELTAITRKAAELAQPQIDDKRHELSVATPAKPVLFVADPTRVEQMLSNLLTNAAKYSEPGRAVNLSAGVEGDEVVFRIRDQGYGITAEMLPKIFGLFTQVDATIDRARGGLGIGLTLVKNLAELHGGGVSATSEGKDKGSEFTLRLPIGQPELRELPAGAPPEPLLIRPVHARHRILIIDDNRDTARMTSRLLDHQGYHMMMAHDGHEGIEAASVFRPDVILLDIGLPGLNGYEVAAALRGDDCCRHSVIVAVSGYGEAAARERSKEVGIDHHLTKPLDFDRLDEILATLAPAKNVV